MYKIPVLSLAIMCFFFNALASPQVKADEEKIIYALGVQLMIDLAPFNLSEKELGIIYKAMKDMKKGELAIDPNQYQERIAGLAQSRSQAIEMAERKKGTAYLDKAKKKANAQISSSGLILFVEKPGKGPKPRANEIVRVHYRGTLVDGTEFDSSYARGEPAEFPLDRVIPCWTDGFTQLRVGAKAKLLCPPKIAYGRRGAPPAVPPGATLTFEVELLSVTPAPKE